MDCNSRCPRLMADHATTRHWTWLWGGPLWAKSYGPQFQDSSARSGSTTCTPSCSPNGTSSDTFGHNQPHANGLKIGGLGVLGGQQPSKDCNLFLRVNCRSCRASIQRVTNSITFQNGVRLPRPQAWAPNGVAFPTPGFPSELPAPSGSVGHPQLASHVRPVLIRGAASESPSDRG